MKRFKTRALKFYTSKSFYFKLLILILISSSSICFAALNQTLNISGEATIRPEMPIRIVDFKLHSLENGAFENYNQNFNKEDIIQGFTLPNLDSAVIYEIKVKNLNPFSMRVDQILKENFSNDDIEYTLTDYEVKDKIHADSTITFKITFKYKEGTLNLPSNTTLESILKFVFMPYDVTPPVISEKSGMAHNFYKTQVQNINLAEYVVAADDVDGDVTDKVSFSTSPPGFDEAKAGTYDVTYNVTDNAGNQATPLHLSIEIWDFVKVNTGHHHTLALTSHGDVYVWGDGANHRCGLGSIADVRVPTKIPNLSNVVDICASYESSFAVTSDGKLYGWGYNGHYCLGDGTTTTRQTPTLISVPTEDKITQVSSFHTFSVCLTEKGEVYAWGWSAYGGNAAGKDTDIKTPTKLEELDGINIKKIASGYYNGAAIAEDGDLYIWGSNSDGVLCRGYTGKKPDDNTENWYNKAKKSPLLSNVKDIRIGEKHLLALLENGDVYTCGSNPYGSLGNGSSTNSYTPYLVMSNCKKVAAHRYNSSLITNDNKVYAWGGNNYGEIGSGNTSDSNIPILNQQLSDARDIDFAIDSSFILTNKSDVYGVGYGAKYIFGNNKTSNSKEVQKWSFEPPAPN